MMICLFFFSSRRRHTRSTRDWSSDVCSSDLKGSSDDFDAARKKAARRSREGEVGDSGDDFESIEWLRSEHAQRASITDKARSEERRVGKECRVWWEGGNEKRK